MMSAEIKNKPNRKRSLFDRFLRNDEGVVAIEFGAVALPFFFLIIGTLETAIVFMASMALDHGMQRTARFVQTGQADAISMSEADFKTMVCDQAVMLPNCADNLNVDVRAFDSFTEAEFTSMTQDDGTPKETEDYEYDIGEEESTVVVRVSYEWTILASFINSRLGNIDSTGNRLLISSWAFKNEPF